MRIGIDARAILDPKGREGAGTGHYTYHLIENLLKIDSENDYFLYFDSRIKETERFERARVKVRQFPFVQYGRFMPVAYSHFLVSAVLGRDKLDVLHSPAGVVPLSYRRPSVVTVRDLAVYHQREWYSRNEELARKLVVPRTMRAADRVITCSEFMRQDVLTRFRLADEKVAAIHNGVEPLVKDDAVLRRNGATVCDKFGIKNRSGKPCRFILYVGSLEPRKNVRGLIAAFDRLVRSGSVDSGSSEGGSSEGGSSEGGSSEGGSSESKSGCDELKLVLAGREGWNYKKIIDEVRRRKLEDRVVFTGYVSPEDKYALLATAEVFVFPSYYEGFGLSVLEAMYFGTPVVTSNISSLPEVAGEAAVLIDPYNTTQIADAVREVLTDEVRRKELIENGKKRVESFTWESAARKTLEVYEEVVATGVKRLRRSRSE
jgi:glycosyltransferase involved in cell wall biosynthesis